MRFTQFYAGTVSAQNSNRILGGTQDNNTIGGPSQTGNTHGIRNSDWFITLGGEPIHLHLVGRPRDRPQQPGPPRDPPLAEPD